jgi:hypothetical protein
MWRTQQFEMNTQIIAPLLTTAQMAAILTSRSSITQEEFRRQVNQHLAYRPCGEKVSENAAKHSLTTAGVGRQ